MKYIEYGVFGDLINYELPKAIFYLLKGDYTPSNLELATRIAKRWAGFCSRRGLQILSPFSDKVFVCTACSEPVMEDEEEVEEGL